MRRLIHILAFSLVCSFNSSAQFENLLKQTALDTNNRNYLEIKDSTEIGTPDGQFVSKTISTAGGTIKSDDGRVELIFPPGALSKETVISIQPTTNHAPNGQGKAYWFEPSGTKFLKPVTIVFRYTKEEAELCHPELMSFALQDKTGKWTRLEFDNVDTIEGVLKGTIMHFSGVAKQDDIKIVPLEHTIRCGKGTGFVIKNLNEHWKDGENKEYSPPKAAYYEYYVNGVLNGDAANGTLSPFGRSWFIYAAPDILPKMNPVTISVIVYFTKKSQRIRAYAKCRITIFEVYKVKVEGKFTGRVGMNAELTDSATFFVGIFPYYAVVEMVKNYEPTVIRNGRVPGIVEEHDPHGAQGPIDLKKTPDQSKVEKVYPYQIKLDFKPAPVITTRFRYLMRGGIVTPWEPEKIDSWYIYIEFQALKDPQVDNYGDGTGSDYKVIIKRHE